MKFAIIEFPNSMETKKAIFALKFVEKDTSFKLDLWNEQNLMKFIPDVKSHFLKEYLTLKKRPFKKEDKKKREWEVEKEMYE